MIGTHIDDNANVIDLLDSLGVATAPFEGVVFRLATPADLPGMADLAAAEIHPDSTVELWTMAADSENVSFLVADVGGRVVSFLAVLPGVLQLDQIEMAFIQIEFVVTAPAYRNRGLVRALTQTVHDGAKKADVPITLIGGLEYFYRQFGYSYAIVEPRRHRLLDLPRAVDPRYSCRLAKESDVASLDALQSAVQQHAQVAVASTDARWRWVLNLEHHPVVVAESAGRIDAMARVYIDESGVELTETSARSVPAAGAIVNYATSLASGEQAPVVVPDRPGGGVHFLHGSNEMLLERSALYVRATSPRVLFDAIVPVLNDRLERSTFHSWSGSLLFSMYTDGLEIVVGEGSVIGLRQYLPDSAPPRGDEAAVPPDLIADLVFGELGVVGLEDRHPRRRSG